MIVVRGVRSAENTPPSRSTSVRASRFENTVSFPTSETARLRTDVRRAESTRRCRHDESSAAPSQEQRYHAVDDPRGDVGGTKTLLGLFRRPARGRRRRSSASTSTLDFDSLDDLVAAFVAETRAPATIEAVCLGVAGPVTGLTARMVNVPWIADATAAGRRSRAARSHCSTISRRWRMQSLCSSRPSCGCCSKASPCPTGNAALIAAGTGLGRRSSINVAGDLDPVTAPRPATRTSPRGRLASWRFVAEMTRIHGRVDNERVISGPGLVNLFRFTHGSARRARRLREIGPDSIGSDLPAAISASALDAPVRAVRGGARDVRRGLWRGSRQPRAQGRCHGRASTSAAASRPRSCPPSRVARFSARFAPRNR